MPVLPPPPPPPPLPLLPPPQAMSPGDKQEQESNKRDPVFLFRGPTKSNTNANLAPLAEGQKRLLCRFSALDAAVVLTVSVEVCAAAPLI